MQGVLGEGYKEDTYYLHYLATHPDHQGRGVGGSLIRHILKEVFPLDIFSDLRRMSGEVVASWKPRSIILMYLFMSILGLKWLKLLRCRRGRIRSRYVHPMKRFKGRYIAC
jgi:GNAT superfamily N-acetyltransferase